MLKGDRKYVFFLISCFSVLIILQLMAPKPIDWKLSYLKRDKIPYGNSALYNALPSLFLDKQIVVKNAPLYNVLKNEPFKETNYIIINDRFEPDKLDVKELLDFVEKGNSVFISANSFSKVFRDSLKFETTVLLNTESLAENKDSVKEGKNYGLNNKLRVNFYNPLFKHTKGYNVEITIGNCFSKFDTSTVTVLGNIMNDKINFISTCWGRGTFYLHSTPEIFVNYNFLKDNNTDYSEKAFSYMPLQTVIWDDYYKEGKIRPNDSPLRVILSHPALASAYYLLIFSILLFMLIGIKRKQRIIPVVEPLQNTTLEFVNTVGALYYQQGSHKEIAEKQIGYFLSFLKSTFRITASDYDDIFMNKLSNLSGIEKDKIKGLFKYIVYIKGKSQVYEQELLQLNKMIEDFYKLNKR